MGQATYTGVFERTEMKYRINAAQFAYIKRALEGRMSIDAYGYTCINSLYFDTARFDLINRSLEKPLYKEKLRLRSYGTPTESSQVFIEMKKKFKGIVYKRRVGVSYAAARAYLGGMNYEDAVRSFPLANEAAQADALSVRSLQIAREIDQFIVRHEPLSASMLISCERSAYAPCAGAADVPSDLRITFDEGIAYRDYRSAGDSNVRLLPSGDVIMEVKCSASLPLWLVRALSACGAYKTSFSKYGEAYKACAAKKGEAAWMLY